MPLWPCHLSMHAVPLPMSSSMPCHAMPCPEVRSHQPTLPNRAHQFQAVSLPPSNPPLPRPRSQSLFPHPRHLVRPSTQDLPLCHTLTGISASPQACLAVPLLLGWPFTLRSVLDSSPRQSTTLPPRQHYPAFIIPVRYQCRADCSVQDSQTGGIPSREMDWTAALFSQHT